MIPNEVVKKAYEYLASVTTDVSRISNVRVEELLKDEQGYWFVTLSYDAIGDFAFEKKKEYKEFKIKDTDGAVEYMKIKQI